MDILLAESLRKLRRERERSQEDLAAHLGVTSQAVSKWERGENLPDVTLLPRIAFYYGVTVDELLGVDKIRIQERLDKLDKRYFELIELNKLAELLALYEEAYRELPHIPKVRSVLMYALWRIASETNDWSRSDEIIALCESLLDCDAEHRDLGIQFLCYEHNRRGEKDIAKKYAEMASDGNSTTKQALLRTLLTGEEAVRHEQARLPHILLDIDAVISTIGKNAKWDSRQIIKSRKTLLHFYETIYEDGDYGINNNVISILHRYIAISHVKLGEYDDAFRHLDLFATHMLAWFDVERFGFRYTSPFVNMLTSEPRVFENEAEYVAHSVERVVNYIKDKAFDPIRGDPRFDAVIQRLRDYAA